MGLAWGHSPQLLMSDPRYVLIDSLVAEGHIPVVVIGLREERDPVAVQCRAAFSPEFIELATMFPVILESIENIIAEIREMTKPPDDQKRNARIVRDAIMLD